MKSLFALFALFVLASFTSLPPAQELGSAKLNLADTNVVITAGLNQGNFKTLKLSVTGATVTISTITVVYGDGAKEEVFVKTVFKEGSTTSKVSIKAENKSISKILVDYSSNDTGKCKFSVSAS